MIGLTSGFDEVWGVFNGLVRCFNEIGGFLMVFKMTLWKFVWNLEGGKFRNQNSSKTWFGSPKISNLREFDWNLKGQKLWVEKFLKKIDLGSPKIQISENLIAISKAKNWKILQKFDLGSPKVKFQKI